MRNNFLACNKHTWIRNAPAKSPASKAWQSWTSLAAAFGEMSPLLSFANKAPIFLELSSISLFLDGFALDPPRAADVSLYSLVKVAMTSFHSAVRKHKKKKGKMFITKI